MNANLSPKLHRPGQRSEPGPENSLSDQICRTAIRSAFFRYDHPNRSSKKQKIPERIELKSNLATKSERWTAIMITRRSTYPVRDPIYTTNIRIFSHEITKSREFSMGTQTGTTFSPKGQRIELKQTRDSAGREDRAKLSSNGEARGHE
jgi:hypothetical protein